MLRSINLGILTLLLTTLAYAQKATITVKIVANQKYDGYAGLSDPDQQFEPVKNNNALVFDAGQSSSRSFNINQPHYIQLNFSYSSPNSTYADQHLIYPLFVSPSDNLSFTINIDKKTDRIVVAGKGSENNQPEIAPLTDVYSAMSTRDTSARHAIEAIIKQQASNKKILDDYIVKYKPSASFIKTSRINAAYYAPTSLYLLKTNTLNYSRNYGVWQAIQDSLFSTIKINNEDALQSYNYKVFLTYFLLRQKEKAWQESEKKATAFYKEWYNTTPAEGKKQFESERKNLFIEKVLNKTFSGKTAEYLYAELIKANLAASNIENIDVIFDHFRQQYPDSKYVSWFTAPVLAVTQRQKQLLNDKMIFVADNGTKLNTFKDVLALTKGKTVLVDMWGTWCAPCREEIEKHSAALREAFKDKDLTFLYVANFDLNHEQEWKRLIAYFNLEGTHILANDGLTNNIMKAVKSNGYPTYILIKKDGTYALTKNQYPVDRQSMADELNEALAIKVQ